MKLLIPLIVRLIFIVVGLVAQVLLFVKDWEIGLLVTLLVNGAIAVSEANKK